MNILEQLRENRLQKIRNRLATEKIEVRKESKWLYEYRVKEMAVWCPRCQQWVMLDIGACSMCYQVLEEE